MMQSNIVWLGRQWVCLAVLHTAATTVDTLLLVQLLTVWAWVMVEDNWGLVSNAVQQLLQLCL